MHRAVLGYAPPSRRRRVVRGLAVVAACATLARSARADDPGAPDPRSTNALLVGVPLELVPFAVSGAMLTNTGDQTVRRASVYVSSAGFTLAPLVAHGIVGEWARGAVFASLPLACGVGLAILMQQPEGDVLRYEGTLATRIPFWAMATTALAASTLGVVDAALAPKRTWRHGLYVVPDRVRSGVALHLGGTF